MNTQTNNSKTEASHQSNMQPLPEAKKLTAQERAKVLEQQIIEALKDPKNYKKTI